MDIKLAIEAKNLLDELAVVNNLLKKGFTIVDSTGKTLTPVDFGNGTSELIKKALHSATEEIRTKINTL